MQRLKRRITVTFTICFILTLVLIPASYVMAMYTATAEFTDQFAAFDHGACFSRGVAYGPYTMKRFYYMDPQMLRGTCTTSKAHLVILGHDMEIDFPESVKKRIDLQLGTIEKQKGIPYGPHAYPING